MMQIRLLRPLVLGLAAACTLAACRRGGNDAEEQQVRQTRQASPPAFPVVTD
jgi:hypothetical protein